MKLKLIKLYLSFFATGYSPKAPGTVGSLATIPLLYLSYPFYNKAPTLFISILIVVTALTCVITHRIQVELQLHDPQWIVIDEVLGMYTTWLFFPSEKWGHLLILFAFFRFFDIVKFWPASYFDKMEHGAGTILDDIVSGVFAGCLYLLLIRTNIIASP